MQEMHTAEVHFRKQNLVKRNHNSDLRFKKAKQGGKIYSWNDSDLN